MEEVQEEGQDQGKEGRKRMKRGTEGRELRGASRRQKACGELRELGVRRVSGHGAI